MMDVNTIVVGALQENCYVVIQGDSALLVDPGSEKDKDIEKIKEVIGDKKLLAVILTHNHFDHIAGVHKFDVPVYMHQSDIDTVKDQKLLSLYAIQRPLVLPDKFLPLNERMEIGPFLFQVIHTPGHTHGGVCLLFKDFIFTGDTLFKSNHGRTDLGGSMQNITNSLKLIASLPANLTVYSGHGPSTTIKDEKGWIDKL